MGDVVNLNHYRKRRERLRAGRRAAENRERLGRTKLERDTATTEAERRHREHDGKRVERTPGDEPA